MMKKSLKMFLYICTSILFTGLNSCAQQTQQQKSSEFLPLDPELVMGKLPNGFTYYIKKTDDPSVYMELVVKAGNLHEGPDQVEYAHLIEHMAFRGTKNFPPSPKYFAEKAGLQYGNEISARTDFEYTYYYMTTLKNDNGDIIDETLKVLRDYAQEMDLDSKKINGERKVVIEEIGYRGTHQSTKNTREYYKRIKLHPFFMSPRNSIESLEKGTDEALIRFYKDWYRPDLQALVVVGDVDVKKMQRKIEQVFTNLHMPAKPRERKLFIPNLDDKNRFVNGWVDQPSTELMIYSNKSQGIVPKTKSDLRDLELIELYNAMIKSRFSEIGKAKDGHLGIHNIFNSVGGILYGAKVMYTAVSVKDADQLKAEFQNMAKELERISRHGFLPQEFSKAKAALKDDILNKRSDNIALANKYREHYVHGEIVMSPKDEQNLRLSLMNSISLEEVNSMAKEWFSEKGRDIVIWASGHARIPAEETVIKWVEEIKNLTITPYEPVVQTEISKPLMDPKVVENFKKVSPVKRIANEEVGTTELKFPNGVTAILKPINQGASNIESGKVKFSGFFKNHVNPSWKHEYALKKGIYRSTLGGWSSTEISQLSEQNKIKIYPVDAKFYGFRGGGASDNLKEILQMIHLYLTDLQFDQTHFEKWKVEQLKPKSNERNKTDVHIYNDSVRAIRDARNFAESKPTKSEVQQFTFKEVLALYQSIYWDTEAFTFVLVGDFNIEKIVPLLSTYLGNVPKRSHAVSSNKKKDTPYIPKANTSKDFFLGDKENRARMDFNFYGHMDKYTEGDYVKIIVTKHILRAMLMDRLRDKENAVYVVYVNFYFSPELETRISVMFESDVVDVYRLNKAVREEVLLLKEQGPDNMTLENARKISKENDLKVPVNNGDWEEYLTDKYVNDRDVEAISHYAEILDKITVEDIRETAKKYLNNNHLMQFTMMPKTMTTDKTK